MLCCNRKYKIPSVQETEFPIVGIIKSYNSDKGYGFIKVLYKRDVFFHVKNAMIKNISEKKYVAFKVRKSKGKKGKNGVEAYDINTLYFYSDILWMNKKNFFTHELDILAYVDPLIMKSYIYTNELALLQDFESKIESYCNDYDIKTVIDSYIVSIVKSHRYKPGDDDMARVDFRGDRYKGLYIISQLHLRDCYVDSILPPYSENIFYDRGFCPWEDMMDSFGGLEEYELEALKKTEVIRKKANDLYNKDTHKNIIMKFVRSKIEDLLAYRKKCLDRNIKDEIINGYAISESYEYSKVKIEDYLL